MLEYVFIKIEYNSYLVTKVEDKNQINSLTIFKSKDYNNEKKVIKITFRRIELPTI